MIFERLTIAVAVAALSGACGNYSNEDLEFMNALPDREDLAAQIPASALSPADEAELSKLTHETTRSFNGFLELLRIIDVIRTYPPTSRAPNVRVWGPVAADEPGWKWRMTMTRTDAQHFRYDLEFHRDIDRGFHGRSQRDQLRAAVVARRGAQPAVGCAGLRLVEHELEQQLAGRCPRVRSPRAGSHAGRIA